jgi:hypothetical protein
MFVLSLLELPSLLNRESVTISVCMLTWPFQGCDYMKYDSNAGADNRHSCLNNSQGLGETRRQPTSSPLVLEYTQLCDHSHDRRYSSQISLGDGDERVSLTPRVYGKRPLLAGLATEDLMYHLTENEVSIDLNGCELTVYQCC